VVEKVHKEIPIPVVNEYLILKRTYARPVPVTVQGLSIAKTVARMGV